MSAPDSNLADAAFTRLCTELEASRFEMDRAVPLGFVKTHCGGRVFIDWPPGYCLRVGTRKYFGIVPYAGRLRRFSRLRTFRWLCFLGIVCKFDTWGGFGPEPWIILTNTGFVFGYESDEDRLHELCTRITKFRSESVRNVPSFYDGSVEGPLRELLWFGCVPPDACRVAMDEDVDPYSVIHYATYWGGAVIHNGRDFSVITIGRADRLNVTDIIDESVLECLNMEGYVMIGCSSRFQRVLLIHVETANVYALMANGYVMKVADSFSMLIRDRLSALLRGRPTSHAPDGDVNYVPIGTQIPFAPHLSYSLPCDTELLCHWVTRYSSIQGWSFRVAAEDFRRHGISDAAFGFVFSPEGEAIPAVVNSPRTRWERDL